MRRMGEVGPAERILRHNLTLDAMHQPTYHTLAQVMMDQGVGGSLRAGAHVGKPRSRMCPKRTSKWRGWNVKPATWPARKWP